MFDDLLKKLELTEHGNKFVAFADDLLVIVEGSSRNEVERNSQVVVDMILEWRCSAKLELSKSKTEAIFLKNKFVYRGPRKGKKSSNPYEAKGKQKKPKYDNKPPKIMIGDSKIKFKSSVRYLWVHFDEGLKVKSHIKTRRAKLSRVFGRMGRIARAEWGL